MTRSGDVLFVGGRFTAFAAPTGSAVLLDPNSATPVSPFPAVPLQGYGGVHVAEPDGAGGWYLGGEFVQVGGEDRPSGLARILADGTVSPWQPTVDGLVKALAVADGTLYVGGFFQHFAGQFRHNVAAVDVATGALLPWNPGTTGIVYTIEVVDDVVYLGGDFLSVSGQSRESIAAVDRATAQVTPWNPGALGSVRAIAVTPNAIWVGGSFSKIGQFQRIGLAALDPVTGVAQAPDPSPGGVRALKTSGDTLFVGGYFSSIAGVQRASAAALDAMTGELLDWDAQVSGSVRDLALDGGNVYLGGAFSSVGGQPRASLAAVDASTAAVLPWNPDVTPRPSGGGSVQTLVTAGGRIFAGGWFTSTGPTVARSHLAAVDLLSGEVLPWSPQVSSEVQALRVLDGVVYAGGSFGVSAVDSVSGTTLWSVPTWGTVLDLAIEGGTIYAGGSFSKMGGQPQDKVAALDASTGAVQAWGAVPDGPVHAIAVDGGTVYLGGSFSTVDGATRRSLAALDATTGALSGWSPEANGPVETMLSSAGAIYIGGTFTAVAGTLRHRLAAIDPTTGATTAWDPDCGGPVSSLTVCGDTVFVGGNFSQIGGEARLRVAAVDATSGAVLPWSHLPTADAVAAVAAADDQVVIGGAFYGVDGTPSAFLAAVSREFVTPPPPPPIYSDFQADARVGVVVLTWTSLETADWTVHRTEMAGGSTVSLTPVPISGSGTLFFADSLVAPSTSYSYQLSTNVNGGLMVTDPVIATTPDWNPPGEAPDESLVEFALGPNPTPNEVVVRYSLREDGPISAAVYTIEGRLVKRLRRGIEPRGNHEIRWAGRDEADHRVGSGVYILRLEFDGSAVTRKVTLRR
jgi:hypothetical protein